jgi:hypothetical protein
VSASDWARLLPEWLLANHHELLVRASSTRKALQGLTRDSIYRRSIAVLAQRHALAAACYRPHAPQLRWLWVCRGCGALLQRTSSEPPDRLECANCHKLAWEPVLNPPQSLPTGQSTSDPKETSS